MLAAELAAGESVDLRRRALVAKIGENISVRRYVVLENHGPLGAYVHGTRIGALVALEGGTAALAHDLAMHVAAAIRATSAPRTCRPRCSPRSARSSPSRRAKEGKSPEIVAKMIEGRLRKSLNEITLLGQPFVKDPEQSIEKLLKGAQARVLRFERFEVGAGIEKKAGGLRRRSHGASEIDAAGDPASRRTHATPRIAGFFLWQTGTQAGRMTGAGNGR